MTLVCPAHISNCGQLFRPFGAHQHSVANGGAAHPRYLYDDRLGCGCGTHKNIIKVTSKSYLEYIYIYIYICIYIYTGWGKKKLTCLICFNLKAKRAITRELHTLHSVLSNLNSDMRPVHFRAILIERAAFKLE